MQPSRHRRPLDSQVAVLGGGIAGCLVACGLADLGYDAVIVDQRERLMDGASRWNDGKIHLGYTFTGTPSLVTAALMQRGAAQFFPVLERLIGQPVAESWLGRPVVYVVDRASLFDAATLWQRAQAVANLLTESAGEWPGLKRFIPASGGVLKRLSVEAAMAETGQRDIVGGWRTGELHVSPREVADHVRRAVGERGIATIRGRVVEVQPLDGGWRTMLGDGSALNSSAVANGLWENRALIDREIAPPLSGEPPVSIRYKRCLFGTAAGLDHLTPSTRILGRFGDISTYRNGDACFSWYPAGLAGRSEGGTPPMAIEDDGEALISRTLDGLGLPEAILSRGTWEVAGGYVVAHGSGDIDDPRSLLHTRDRPAVRELGPGYFSLDTGKYTLGPMLAAEATGMIARHLGPARSVGAMRLAASA